jgi:hypothetical protein
VTQGTDFGFILVNKGNCTETLRCRDAANNLVGIAHPLGVKENVAFMCPNTAVTMTVEPGGVAADGNSIVRSVGWR